MTLKKLTNDHYIIVDDSEIKMDDWYLDDTNTARQAITECESYWTHRKNYKKITHSTRPESLGMGWMQSVLPLLLSEVKELIGEVDVEKKAYLAAQKKYKLEHIPLEQIDEYGGEIKQFVQNFIITYNQALEDNKEKKYTKEDLKKTWNAAYIDAMSIDEETYKPLFFEDFIQSLQPKTEWEVEFVDGKLKLK